MLVLYSPINLGSARETKKLQPAPRFMCFSKGLGFLVILEFSRVFLLPQEHMCPSLKATGYRCCKPVFQRHGQLSGSTLRGGINKETYFNFCFSVPTF